MKVGCPLPARVWGLQMMHYPFSCDLRESRPAQWAAWCMLFSHYAQDVAAELLASLPHGRLWYLPPALVRGMRDIGLRALVGDHAKLLDRALYAILQVRWEHVDPGACQRPNENYLEAPLYKTGDIVPPEGGDLYVTAALRRFPHEAVQCRGEPMRGDLSNSRTDQGRGTAPP